jgi:hypothetical protein
MGGGSSVSTDRARRDVLDLLDDFSNLTSRLKTAIEVLQRLNQETRTVGITARQISDKTMWVHALTKNTLRELLKDFDLS